MHVPWMTEQAASAAGSPSPSVNVPAVTPATVQQVAYPKKHL